MKNIQSLIVKNFAVGLFSSTIYGLVEICWRGFTHWTMLVLAFIVGLILSYINNEFLEFDDFYEYQVLFGTVISTIFEYIFGMIFNQDFSIWDYRGSWGTIHLLGDQVNLVFIGAWALICFFGLPMLDFLQWKLDLAPEPYYTFILTGKKRYYIFKRKGE